jgi:hypothetical protein
MSTDTGRVHECIAILAVAPPVATPSPRHLRPDRLPYSTMTVKQIAALPAADLAAEAAHCWLWTTNSFLEAGLHVLRSSGFTYLPLDWAEVQASLLADGRPFSPDVFWGGFWPLDTARKRSIRRRTIGLLPVVARTLGRARVVPSIRQSFRPQFADTIPVPAGMVPALVAAQVEAERSDSGRCPSSPPWSGQAVSLLVVVSLHSPVPEFRPWDMAG